MTAKELRKLRRSDLMEMLLELSKENLQLRHELEEANLRLAEKQTQIEEVGSLTDAVLKLEGLFARAKAVCEHYERNTCLCSQQPEEKIQQKGDAVQTGRRGRRRKGSKREK